MSLMPIFCPILGPATVTYATHVESTSDLTEYTFAGAAIGTAGDRKVVVGVGGSNVTRTVSGMTIGGVAATMVVRKTGASTASHELWQASVPSGTTADIVVTWSGAQVRTAIVVWAVYGAASAATDGDSTSGTDPLSVTVDVPAGGVCIGFAGTQIASSFAWTGLTEDSDTQFEANHTVSGASGAFAAATALTVTADQANSVDQALVVATWGPA